MGQMFEDYDCNRVNANLSALLATSWVTYELLRG